MSNEQINIAIEEIIRPALHGNIYRPPRDYCNDLNAIQEVVMTLPENKQVLYGVRLAWECGHTDKKSVGLWHISTATAYHRAVAFLKTLEKMGVTLTQFKKEEPTQDSNHVILRGTCYDGDKVVKMKRV